jgi:hypothetical protein
MHRKIITIQKAKIRLAYFNTYLYVRKKASYEYGILYILLSSV